MRPRQAVTTQTTRELHPEPVQRQPGVGAKAALKAVDTLLADEGPLDEGEQVGGLVAQRVPQRWRGWGNPP
jgi:hypothetical protein